MDFSSVKQFASHGDGAIHRDRFKALGANVIFESGVLVFHPENISLGDNIYIGHNSILKGYYRNEMTIGSHTWIGQDCFFHSAGGITIGKAVGIGPNVKMLTSNHVDGDTDLPVMHNELEFKPIVVGDGADIGVGTVILPGVTIGKGAIVGAGSVVTKDVPDYAVVAGVPARLIRMRTERSLA
ncbi:MAG: acyltransferase [Candidatus Zixiibacteriota bacterium]